MSGLPEGRHWEKRSERESPGATVADSCSIHLPFSRREVKNHLTQKKTILKIYSFTIISAISLCDVLYS